MPLNSTVRATLRNKALTFLIDTCTIEAKTQSVDEIGAPVNAWIVVASSVPCRVVMAGRSNANNANLAAMQESMTDTYKLSVPVQNSTYNWTLAIDQRITINSVIYNVVSIEDGLTDTIFRQAILTRERAGNG